MGAAGVFGVPPVFRRTNTLRCRFAEAWFTQPMRTEAREGTARAKALATTEDDVLRRGASRSWNHGRGTRAARLKRHETGGASDLLFLRGGRTERPATDGLHGTQRCAPAFPRERTEKPEPQERQRASCAREAWGGENRRGGEKPRGRTVPGEANPGHADPPALVAGGARNPRRGDPGPRGPGEGSATRTLRGRRKSVGASRVFGRGTGRTTEHLVPRRRKEGAANRWCRYVARSAPGDTRTLRGSSAGRRRTRGTVVLLGNP